MTDRLLYALHVPANAQLQSRADRRRNLSAQGLLDTGTAVEGISLDPGEQLLTGVYADKFGALNAAEIEELFAADSIEVVPLTARGTDSAIDGYYALRDVEVRQEVPQRTDKVQRFDGVLAKAGTRRNHFRAVRTAVDSSISNPFGSDSTIDLAVSQRAGDVQWFDNQGGTTESATVQSTATGEHDDLDVYDASEPSFDDPWLVYDIPYALEWPTDCRVWDDYDRQQEYSETVSSATVSSSTQVGSATVGETRTVASQWQRVFVPDHDYIGQPVIESDRLRLRPDRADGVLRAYQWNATDEHYDLVQLGASAWRLQDWDVRTIGLGRIDSRAVFGDGTSTHRIDVAVRRGLDTALITPAPNAGSIPSGLQTRLSPIADDGADDPGERVDLVKRSEVQ